MIGLWHYHHYTILIYVNYTTSGVHGKGMISINVKEVWILHVGQIIKAMLAFIIDRIRALSEEPFLLSILTDKVPSQ